LGARLSWPAPSLGSAGDMEPAAMEGILAGACAAGPRRVGRVSQTGKRAVPARPCKPPQRSAWKAASPRPRRPKTTVRALTAIATTHITARQSPNRRLVPLWFWGHNRRMGVQMTSRLEIFSLNDRSREAVISVLIVNYFKASRLIEGLTSPRMQDVSGDLDTVVVDNSCDRLQLDSLLRRQDDLSFTLNFDVRKFRLHTRW
jgi:hypothetical protein